MSVRQEIQTIFAQAIGNGEPAPLEEPKNLDYGDYATNIALHLAKPLKKAPKVIARELASKLAAQTADFIFSEINGFINIRVSDRRLFQELAKITPDYGKPDPDMLFAPFGSAQGAPPTAPRRQKILLEYVSANPTGPLHIGHGRWAVIGDVLARTLVYCGQQVTREFYINDAGGQIANFVDSVQAVRQNQPVPENGYHGAYIQELAKLAADPVQTMLDQQKATLQNIRSEFDSWFSEKTLHESGAVDSALEILRRKNLLYTGANEYTGALVFRSTDFGDDKDRVLVKSNGEKTYFTADIAYHQNKLDRGFDRLINIWGADHHGYIARVRAAIEALTGRKNVLQVILGQLVNLFRGGAPVKMSKRTGELITLQEVIEEIGVDAARYFLAAARPDTALDFDLELAKKQSNDNPVYYVQYAYARICSILRQAEIPRGQVMASPPDKLETAERMLILKMIRLPEEIETIARNYAIHRLCAYAQELAALFHNFYHECRVISEDIQTTARRLQIIQAAQTILKIIFDLLAVKAPEKM
ncbi:MAG: arginine--tRNA ligase [Candidatus Margulisbacteria bacterium]|nr:arginine--tRNA ligase [Candidatus Margulisiibacteriota bacterium]